MAMKCRNCDTLADICTGDNADVGWVNVAVQTLIAAYGQQTGLQGHFGAIQGPWHDRSALDTVPPLVEETYAGHRAEELSILASLVERLRISASPTELVLGWLIPDAAETMIRVGWLGQAEALITLLENEGAAAQQSWITAVAARCRAELLVARGDIEAATVATQRSLEEHRHISLPFERACTLLLLGKLLRRVRRKRAAVAAFGEALRAFDELGLAPWVVRVQEELGRAKPAHASHDVLTPTELRVAELAASGLRNRDVAATLFISPKTVEVNLSRIYRKLGVRSRTQLSRVVGPFDEMRTA